MTNIELRALNAICSINQTLMEINRSLYALPRIEKMLSQYSDDKRVQEKRQEMREVGKLLAAGAEKLNRERNAYLAEQQKQH